MSAAERAGGGRTPRRAPSAVADGARCARAQDDVGSDRADGPRRAVARVDVGAIRRNVERLAAVAGDGVLLAPVVKADGYGHGAALAAGAARAAGARWLCVATAAEALALRRAGHDGIRILVLGALSEAELPDALAAGADIALWDPALLRRLPGDARVHVKLDSGLGRLGTRDARAAKDLADAAGDRLAGVWTHFATAEDHDDPFFEQQLERFARWALPLRRPGVLAHAANSAALLRAPGARVDPRFDLVRPGVAIYGLDPFGGDPAAHGLVPALRFLSWVAAVKRCRAGESAGYGRRFVARRDTFLATLPIGYGDGWRRALGERGGEVSIGGRRFPLAGTISMDNMTVDLGPAGGGVRVGDEAVLLGDGITAEQVAASIGTINYEVLTALSARVLRVPVG
ncbi:alanine racemase [Conexibacter sp. CPCC 206217]|uniref:alanine racemase n=1 Tax=Conexibacter sp. CPCC 206217 TaxID=3064574 RepID=UPI00271E1250|nr:alanine racemase [Conexibacter sp. CPCC 206217]MDO8211745.1 alanine racemase [Conexibacter sp. CPCC 206217]